MQPKTELWIKLTIHCKNTFDINRFICLYKEVTIPFGIHIGDLDSFIKTKTSILALYSYLNHIYSGRYNDFFKGTDNSNLYQSCFYSVEGIYTVWHVCILYIIYHKYIENFIKKVFFVSYQNLPIYNGLNIENFSWPSIHKGSFYLVPCTMVLHIKVEK